MWRNIGKVDENVRNTPIYWLVVKGYVVILCLKSLFASKHLSALCAKNFFFDLKFNKFI